MDQNQDLIERPRIHVGRLSNVKSLIIQQQRDLRETLRGTEEPNIYFILDNISNEKLYTVRENVSCLQQQCCGGMRGFNLNVYDEFNRPVITLERKSACLANSFCLFGLCTCLEKVMVRIKDYTTTDFHWNEIGYVKQTWNPLFPTFVVCDAKGK